MDKISFFVEKRRRNFSHLKARMKSLEHIFVLPEATQKSQPSWFGFLLSLRPESGFDRAELINFLNSRMIGTRLLFAGNLTKQPYFKELSFRTIGDLKNTDFVMRQSFWVGLHPSLSSEMLDFICDSIEEFVAR